MTKNYFLTYDVLLYIIDVVVGMYGYFERTRAAVDNTPKRTSGYAINQVWWKYDVVNTFQRILGKMKGCVGFARRFDGRSLNVAMSSH